MTNEQPKVHLIDGKRYGEVERRAKVGDNIVITKLVNGGEASFTIGNIYKVISNEYDSFLDVIDDDGDLAGILHDEYHVLEPIDSEEELVTASADNPDQIIELLGNLARRVTELEQRVSQSGEKFTAKQVAEIIKAIGVGAND